MANHFSNASKVIGGRVVGLRGFERLPSRSGRQNLTRRGAVGAVRVQRAAERDNCRKSRHLTLNLRFSEVERERALVGVECCTSWLLH